MTAPADPKPAIGHVTVRYWASVRAAAGVPSEQVAVVGEMSLAELMTDLLERHSDRHFSRVLQSCSVLVGDRPASSTAPADIRVQAGETVEFLPPFAGG